MHHKSIRELVYEKLVDAPKKNILKDNWTNWTWEQLVKRSLEYTNVINDNFSNTKNLPVPILVGRSGESVAAIIGTIISDHPFVPISNDLPVKRIKEILNSIDSKKILLGLHKSEKIPKKINTIKINKKRLQHKLKFNASNSETLYILFTSGSTGTPKGVMCSHENIRNTMEWNKNEFSWNKNDIIGGVTKFSFDISLFDLFTMIYFDVPLAILKDVSIQNEVIKQIKKFKVTSIFSVPAFFSQFTDRKFSKNISDSSIKRIISGGDFFPPKHIIFWKKNFPKISIFNVWGPTETSIVNTSYKILKKDIKNLKNGEFPPIGKSTNLMKIIILDEKNQKITNPNKIGELVVIGKSVSLGYYNNKNQTRKKFIKINNEHGYKTGDLGYYNKNEQFYMTGRNDNLVKIQGFRIDLSEIQKALNKFPKIHSNIVFINEKNEFQKEIISVIELEKNKNEIDIFKIKMKLRKIFPSYMVPKRIIKIEKLPKNANGKIDKNILLKQLEQNKLK